MRQDVGYMGDLRFATPEHDAFLMRQEAEGFAEIDPRDIDDGTMEEIKQTAGLLMGIIAAKRETQ